MPVCGPHGLYGKPQLTPRRLFCDGPYTLGDPEACCNCGSVHLCDQANSSQPPMVRVVFYGLQQQSENEIPVTAPGVLVYCSTVWTMLSIYRSMRPEILDGHCCHIDDWHWLEQFLGLTFIQF